MARKSFIIHAIIGFALLGELIVSKPTDSESPNKYLPGENATRTFGDEAHLAEMFKTSDRSKEEDPLLDLEGFRYLHTPPPEKCCQRGRESKGVFFQFLVHSNPNDGDRRQLIRQTWGSVQSVEGHPIQVVFLLGDSRDIASRGSRGEGEHHRYKNRIQLNRHPEEKPLRKNGKMLRMPGQSKRLRAISKAKVKEDGVVEFLGKEYIKAEKNVTLDEAVAEEARIFGDIVQGNFHDSQYNQSYKHLMGYKWAKEASALCPKQRSPVFLVKTDDHVFVEIFHLFKFAMAIYGDSPSRSLVCDVVPSGTSHTHRKSSEPSLSSSEQIPDVKVKNPRLNAETEQILLDEPLRYPEYCSGTAYLMTPDLTEEFLQASTQVPKIADDSVYVMGFLREYLGLRPFYLNLRYTREEKAFLRWLRGRTGLPFPYLFAKMDTEKPDWKEVFRALWDKTLGIYQKGARPE